MQNVFDRVGETISAYVPTLLCAVRSGVPIWIIDWRTGSSVEPCPSSEWLERQYFI